MNIVNKIGIGTAQFGTNYGISNTNGQTTRDEVADILSFATEIGIKYIDTASAYGDAEYVLGRNNLSNFKVVSKFMPSTVSNSIESQFYQSLEKLKVEKLYGFLAHRPIELTKNTADWLKLKDFRERGMVEKIGFSLNHPNEMEFLVEKNMIPDLVQIPFNYFDNRFYETAMQLKNQGCEIHSRSTFLQGLFFADTSSLSDYFSSVKSFIDDMQNTYKDKLHSVLLNYVLNQSFIDVVILGVENLHQLKLNIENCDILLHDLPNIKVDDRIIIPSRWPKN